MADPRFFEKSAEIDIAALAALTQSCVAESFDGTLSLEDVAPLDQAEAGHVSFLDNIKYKEQLLVTKAGACFVSEEMSVHVPDGCVALVSASPYKSYALAAQYFYPESMPEAQISENAVIADSAVIAEGVRIDAGAVIGENVEIGAGSWVEAGAVISNAVKIGEQCRIGLNAAVSHALIGDHVRLYPNVSVGQDGFGFAIDPRGHVKVPQLGRVIIEDHVQIGANTAVDRGSGPDTVIGQGTWIDNLVQIAHNVKIGKGCVIVGQSGISGSTVLEDYVVLAGQAGVAGHLHIGMGAQIGGKSGVLKDVPAGAEMMGYPAVPLRQFLRQAATLARLIKPQK